jgi:hypothetical protein
MNKVVEQVDQILCKYAIILCSVNNSIGAGHCYKHPELALIKQD